MCQNLMKMFEQHLNQANMNTEQWDMPRNQFLIHIIFLKRISMPLNKMLLITVEFAFFFCVLFEKKILLHIENETSSNKDPVQRKPPVPNIRDVPKMGTRTEKNFIQTNALDVVMTVPKKPERNVVDDRFGDKFPIDQSGLTPKYLLKKVFFFL